MNDALIRIFMHVFDSGTDEKILSKLLLKKKVEANFSFGKMPFIKKVCIN